jgi:glutathione S-transferase
MGPLAKQRVITIVEQWENGPMGEIEPANKAVLAFKGLHLYHTGRSNCSGRVRLLIEEKGLAWTSHHVDLYTKENISEEYFGINPKGVVPTLVHDGRVIVESNDILVYLEDSFPQPSFTSASKTDRAAMTEWLRRSGALHVPAIKTFAYAKVNASLVVKTPQEVELYRKLQKDPDLLAFHAKHDLPGSAIPQADVERAAGLLRGALGEIDGAIARHAWIVGDQYSLADISWAPTITTLQRAGFPLPEFPHVMSWYARINERPAWQRAMTYWQTPPKPKVMEMPAAARR